MGFILGVATVDIHNQPARAGSRRADVLHAAYLSPPPAKFLRNPEERPGCWTLVRAEFVGTLPRNRARLCIHAAEGASARRVITYANETSYRGGAAFRAVRNEIPKTDWAT